MNAVSQIVGFRSAQLVAEERQATKGGAAFIAGFGLRLI
jgi:hypothetical protein